MRSKEPGGRTARRDVRAWSARGTARSDSDVDVGVLLDDDDA